MKNWLRLCILLLSSILCLNGQDHKIDGLLLTGTIVGLNAVAECGGTDGRILVQVDLSLQFRNNGDKPLIVFKPFSESGFRPVDEFGGTRVLFLRSLPSTAQKESERTQVKHLFTDAWCRPGKSYSSNYDPITDFINRIDLRSPTSNYFVVIEPRSYHEFREVVTLDAGYEVDVKLGKSLKEARIRSEFPAFHIQYHLSLKRNLKGEDFLQSLQSRWKPVGNFVLDENGNFTVTSEPIINRSSE